MKNHLRICFLALATWSSLGSVANATSIEEASKIKWTMPNLPVLRSKFPNSGEVQEFVRRVVAGRNDVQDDPNVTEFNFSDLSGDGQLELICILDVSGRGLARGLVVITQIGDHFTAAIVDASGLLADLPSMIVNLRNDRRKQILVSNFLSVEQGTTPVPEIDDVYEYQSTRLVYASKKYSDYYRNIAIPRDKAKLTVAESQKESPYFENMAERELYMSAIRKQLAYEEMLAQVR